MFFAASNINWGGKNWEDILEADARGYYAYLPALFIYGDPQFGFFDSIERKYPRKNLYYDYRQKTTSGTVNKYFAGTALAELPFFLAGHALAGLSGEDADGYTRFYFICINAGAVVYAFFILYYMALILRRYGVSDRLIAFIIPVLAFGTHMYLYTLMDPGMSHIYSMLFFAMFMHYAFRYFDAPGLINLYRLAILLGIIILIRPSNAMILFALPFLAGSADRLKMGFKFLFKKPVHFIGCIVTVMLIAGIQLLWYRAATGQFFVYSYSAERFYFDKPHIIEILFSYRRGLFLYTPVLLISLAGLFILYRKNGAWPVVTLTGFLMLVIYVLSCWWMWWYGGGFSGRVFVEYMPFFFILLGLMLEQTTGKRAGKALQILLVVLTLICQIQIYQYRHYHIHWDSTTKELYWENFLRIDKLL